MTENEAGQVIECMGEKLNDNSLVFYTKVEQKALDMAIQALEEIQEYRAIGTVEKLKALKEKNEPKKVEVNEFDYGEGYVCGECESFLHYVDDDDEHIRTNYCCHCGTKIDWQ